MSLRFGGRGPKAAGIQRRKLRRGGEGLKNKDQEQGGKGLEGVASGGSLCGDYCKRKKREVGGEKLGE